MLLKNCSDEIKSEYRVRTPSSSAVVWLPQLVLLVNSESFELNSSNRLEVQDTASQSQNHHKFTLVGRYRTTDFWTENLWVLHCHVALWLIRRVFNNKIMGTRIFGPTAIKIFALICYISVVTQKWVPPSKEMRIMQSEWQSWSSVTVT